MTYALTISIRGTGVVILGTRCNYIINSGHILFQFAHIYIPRVIVGVVVIFMKSGKVFSNDSAEYDRKLIEPRRQNRFFNFDDQSLVALFVHVILYRHGLVCLQVLKPGHRRNNQIL